MMERRTLLKAGLTTAVFAPLVACGNDNGQSAPAGQGAGGGGRSGGTAIVANTADAQPQFVMANRQGNPWVPLTFEKLVSLDPNTFDIVPGVARSWDFSSDGMSASFELDEGVVFHNGRELTPEDVIYSLEQAANPENGSQLAFLAERIAELRADGANRLEMTFKEPTPNIIDLLDLIPIVDSETFGNIADGREVIGTGPFRWDNWSPGAGIDFARFEDFRRADDVQLDGVRLNVITDSTALVSAMRSNSAHIALNMAPLDAKAMTEGSDTYSLVNGTGSVYPIGLNPNVEALSDKRIRQAVGYAIDKQRIADQIFGGMATPTSVYWSPADPVWNEEQASRYTFDPDRARELIDEAGGAGSITIQLPQYPANQGIYEVVANNLTEVGFTVQGETLTSADYNQRQVDRNMGDAWLPVNGTSAWSVATIMSAQPNLIVGNNLAGFNDPQYETLANEFVSADGDEARVDAGQDLTEYILDEAFVLPLVAAPSSLVERAIDGVRYTSNNSVNLENASLA